MKTAYTKSQEAREQAICEYYHNLASKPGAMKTACEEATMKKFKIYARSTIWQICRRVAQRRAQKA